MKSIRKMGNGNLGRDDERLMLYLVRETKSIHDTTQLRPNEDRRIICGERHFETLDVDYRLSVSAGKLP